MRKVRKPYHIQSRGVRQKAMRRLGWTLTACDSDSAMINGGVWDPRSKVWFFPTAELRDAARERYEALQCETTES